MYTINLQSIKMKMEIQCSLNIEALTGVGKNATAKRILDEVRRVRGDLKFEDWDISIKTTSFK